ncbi:MAG TPA: MFS transporter [Chloroflexia bacterium]|nr:MFS transporter [Chloroflexia bacterium]
MAQVVEEKEAGAKGAERVTFVTILRNRNFRNLWLGQIVSQVGDYFAFLAIMVVVSGFSEDPASVTGNVSGVMIALTLPRLLFGVLAGIFVDRWDRRRTMIVSDMLRMALTLGMIPAFMSKNLLLMYALAFAMSTVGAFFNPAKGALIPNLVPTEHLMSANALSQTSMTMAFFVGPALAGSTFALVGNGNQWIAFVIDSVSFLVSALALLAITMPRKSAITTNSEIENPKSELSKVLEELRVGLKALLLSRTMATLTVVFAVTMLGVGALNVLWVAFLKVNLGFTNESELAWRFSIIDIAFFAGMAIASVAVGNFLSHLAPKWFVVWGLILAGIATVPLGYLPDYWLIVAVMFLVGLFVAPINTGSSTLMQIVVPNSQLGRVGGGIGTVTEVASITSMGLAGVLGATLGIPLVFSISGVTLVIAGALAWIALPNLTLKDKVEEEASADAFIPMEQAANVA